MATRILFVCMGNICRSPAAEGVMKHLVKERGLETEFEIDSAGTIGYHTGERADSRMRGAAIRRGYDLTSLSRQIQTSDLRKFDLVLCADNRNLEDVRSLDRTGVHRDKIRKILDYGDHNGLDEVPDPYYGGPDGFEHVLDLLEEACNALLDNLSEPPKN